MSRTLPSSTDPLRAKHLGGPSFWWQQIGLPTPRPGLNADLSADVCIIGAGYTGLWTALALRNLRPDLQIAILEAEFAGFGASGRNGGWLTGGFAWSHDRYAASSGEASVRAMVATLSNSVSQIIAQAADLGIDADILPTDELLVATNPAQLARLQNDYRHRSMWGEAAQLQMLSGADVASRLRVPGALGALAVSGVARIHPAKLVQGLARAAEAQGIRILEQTRALALHPGRVETAQGIVRAPIILRCTEGYTAQLPGHKRALLPLNSAQIVTQPLPASVWSKIGWQGYEIIGDYAHSYCYCQRTGDGRIVYGGRGTPYRFGSGIDDGGRPDGATVVQLTAGLHRLFPDTQGYAIDHAWCGVLGVPRDWCASVQFNPATGIGSAGGYVGVGVATSWLAGRALAALALGQDDPVTRLAMVNHPSRRWEPEPLRWLALHGLYAAYHLADRAEARGGPPSRLAALVNRLAGR